jgi:hypothetical protein
VRRPRGTTSPGIRPCGARSNIVPDALAVYAPARAAYRDLNAADALVIQRGDKE